MCKTEGGGGKCDVMGSLSWEVSEVVCHAGGGADGVVMGEL
jgi:hypothetical protein